MKDQIVKDYTIKIRRLREVKKIGAGTSYKEKEFLVEIENHIGSITTFSVPIKDYRESLKETLKLIMEEIY